MEDLASLGGHIATFERELAILQLTLEKHLSHLESLERASADLIQAERESDRSGREMAARQKERVEAVTRFETLEKTQGKTVAEVCRQLSAGKLRETEIRNEIKAANLRYGDLKALLGRLEADIGHLSTEIKRAEEERGHAIARLISFAENRLLLDAIADFQPFQKEDWSPTRAVQVAREIEARLKHIDAEDQVWQRLDSKIHQTINDLIDELRPRGFEPFQDKVDEVMRVLVPIQGREHTMTELARMIAEQMTDRRELLGAKERHVLEKHLIDEIAQVLHDMLRECESLVTKMNMELASRPTSSGFSLKFLWNPRPETTPGLLEARKLLMRSRAAWSPEERKALGRFLQRRIEQARQDTEIGTLSDHLNLALDYRQGHHFAFQIGAPGNWRTLDRRSHGEKSGGEKATALMLLQLAAAAAHYQSAGEHAPRLILLDEAFVGVDDRMRAQCMGLFATFDLDFLMTSEREMGCYKTLPGVAICQLSGRPGIDAVYVERMVWNGERQVSELEWNQENTP